MQTLDVKGIRVPEDSRPGKRALVDERKLARPPVPTACLMISSKKKSYIVPYLERLFKTCIDPSLEPRAVLKC